MRRHFKNAFPDTKEEAVAVIKKVVLRMEKFKRKYIEQKKELN